jgi:hypothetical protein
MRATLVLGAALAAACVCAGGAGAQETEAARRFRIAPFVTYGFYGALPDDGPELRGDVGLGVRAAVSLAPRWAVYGVFRRTTPELEEGGRVEADHWSAGAEYTLFPGPAGEDGVPLRLEAGVGQARFRFGGVGSRGSFQDLAVHVGIASELRITRALSLRYGAEDYASDFGDGEGIVHHFFAHAGGELRF